VHNNGHAGPEPPEQPAPVELTVAQKLLRLKSGACKATGDPLGDPAGFAFSCRSPALIGKPYCELHYARSVIPRLPWIARPRKRRAIFAPTRAEVAPEVDPAELELDAALEADAPQIEPEEPCARYETIPMELAG
jgi:hypothetical protein